jgi:hypothetical protein
MKMKKEHIEVIHKAFGVWFSNEENVNELKKVLAGKYSHVSLAWQIFKACKIEGDSNVWAFDNLSYLEDSHKTTIFVREFKHYHPSLIFTTR